MGAAVLITGAHGFAGRFLADQAAAAGARVLGPPRTDLDLADADATRAFVATERPAFVFHLAASASVRDAWRAPAATLHNNVDSALNLLEAVRAGCPEARVLIASSGEVYGPPERLPVDEAHPLRPQNPYAVSKAAADLLAGFYADAHGLHVIRARSFNHAGPGQSPTYVVSAFARQIAVAEREGSGRAEIVTGELGARRDFTDVRDVVRAYWLLLASADPGVYNVCSGESIEVGSILRLLAEEAGIVVEQRTDPALLRANEVMDITGSHEKLTAATGWRPEIPRAQTVRDTLDWWRQQVRA